MIEMIWLLMASTLRVSTPFVFAAMGGMVSERSGEINIALEGLMLVSAFAAAAATLQFQSPWVGALAGVVFGAVFALFYALFVVRLRANQIVAGTAIYMLAAGVGPFACKLLYGAT